MTPILKLLVFISCLPYFIVFCVLSIFELFSIILSTNKDNGYVLGMLFLFLSSIYLLFFAGAAFVLLTVNHVGLFL